MQKQARQIVLPLPWTEPERKIERRLKVKGLEEGAVVVRRDNPEVEYVYVKPHGQDKVEVRDPRTNMMVRLIDRMDLMRKLPPVDQAAINGSCLPARH